MIPYHHLVCITREPFPTRLGRWQPDATRIASNNCCFGERKLISAISSDSIADVNKSLVVDTNVFVSALLSGRGASREVLRRCLQGRYRSCVSLALFAEYRELLGRGKLFAKCPLRPSERDELFRAFMAVSRLTEIYYLWRPNLPDESDNHVLELAVAARADVIVTHNRADFVRSELRFPELRILTPAQLLKET